MQSEAAQIVAHAPRAEVAGTLTEQCGEMSAQLRIVEPLRLHAEEHQSVEKRLGAGVTKAQRRGALPIDFDGAHHLLESVFADGAIVRDGLDVEESSVGLEADATKRGQIGEALTMDVWRPCDTVEVARAWIAAIERKDGPTSLLLSRQNVAFQQRTADQISAIARGGYALAEADGLPRAVIMATGSEVPLALDARKRLAAEGISVRVVSMPSTTVFDRQDPAWRESVLPTGVPRVAVEAGVSDFWRKYVGLEGAVVGIDRYGESAPAAELFRYFGFTVENVVRAVKGVL